MTPAKESDQSQHDLMIVVVQGQDADEAIQSLADEGISVTRLPSVGGFLGRKNATLMLDIETNQYEKAIELLNNTCRKRVAFIAVPMESAPLPMPAPTPITIGGANVFSLEVEHYEEF